MYVHPNFKTKKALREAVKAGEHVTVYQPGGVFGYKAQAREVLSVEGPYYPEPHTWYARVRTEWGIVKEVVG